MNYYSLFRIAVDKDIGQSSPRYPNKKINIESDKQEINTVQFSPPAQYQIKSDSEGELDLSIFGIKKQQPSPPLTKTSLLSIQHPSNMNHRYDVSSLADEWRLFRDDQQQKVTSNKQHT
jgi:hypothetical protein